MIIKEAKLMSVTRGKYKDISIRFIVKPEDYTMEEYEKLCDQAIDGQVGALVWEKFNPDGQVENLPIVEAVERRIEQTKSIYSRFRADVMRDFGLAAYEKVKTRLGVEHLKDLEAKMEFPMIERLLGDELVELRKQAGFYDMMN